MTPGSLWNYYRDEIDDVDDNASDGKSFNYKTKTEGKTPQRPAQPDPDQDGNSRPRPPLPSLNVEVTIPLKCLSKFRRFLDLPLINSEIELDLSWTNDCVFSQHDSNIAGAKFQINNAKLYVPVGTLSINDNIKFLENIKQGFKRTISWNKCRSEITTQLKDFNFDYLIDPTFRKINRLFVLSFKNGSNDPTKNFFDKYYMPLVEIKILMH